MNKPEARSGSVHPPRQASDCPRVVLAEGSVGRVETCTCGMVLLHTGPVTLRLTVGAFQELSALLVEAVSQGVALQEERALRACLRVVPQA